MYSFSIKIIAFVLFQLQINSKPYNPDNYLVCPQIYVELILPQNHFSISDEKNIIISICNIGENDIKIPEWLVLGRLNDYKSEIIFSIQKKNRIFNVYQDVNYDQNKHYNYLSLNRKKIDLIPNAKVEFEKDLDFIHRLNTPGHYRVRAIFRLSEYIDCKEFNSRWIEFFVEE
jgi:hypothetical protein